jgi:hypothetical protein
MLDGTVDMYYRVRKTSVVGHLESEMGTSMLYVLNVRCYWLLAGNAYIVGGELCSWYLNFKKC